MIFFGSEKLGKIVFGEHELSKIYFGNNLVYENSVVKKFESGKSFNVADVYSNYSELTADNFYYLSFTDVTGGDTLVGTGFVSIRGSLNKYYDVSTGQLTSYHFHNSNSSNVVPVLVSKPSKLVLIGTGTSFDVKTLYPNDYQDFTEDNFLVQAGATNSYIYNGSRTYQGTWTATSTRSFVKTYNTSTGILTCYFKEKGSTNIGESWDGNENVTVFFTAKKPQ